MSVRAPAGDRTRGSLAVAPAVLVVLAVVSVGLGAAVLQSLGLMPLVGTPQLDAGAYLADPAALAEANLLSLEIATASTLLAALVGCATSLLLLASPRAARLLAGVASSAIPVPHLVGAVSVGLLLSDGGILARWLGVGEGWPHLVAGSWPTAVVLEYAWKESAFVALVVTAALVTRVADYHETAALLGADARQRLWRVTLPLAAPPLLAASAITFAYTLGSYEVAWLLGPIEPEALPVLSYRLFTSADLAARPEAMAVAVVTTVLAAASAVAALAVLRRMVVWR